MCIRDSDYIKDYDGNAIWIKAENEGTMIKSFRKLAIEKLGISTKDTNGEEKQIESIVNLQQNKLKDPNIQGDNGATPLHLSLIHICVDRARVGSTAKQRNNGRLIPTSNTIATAPSLEPVWSDTPVPE